jgi:hypothetical protein
VHHALDRRKEEEFSAKNVVLFGLQATTRILSAGLKIGVCQLNLK